ncbi:hypothetical protein CG001_00110 [Mesoplasma coleopterae]|nr:hypothetical protein CG001_00110 [Mesoplasma coleopterae]AVN62727.1 hypothetical protein CG000_00145 [Mesoplasma coleopterae]
METLEVQMTTFVQLNASLLPAWTTADDLWRTNLDTVNLYSSNEEPTARSGSMQVTFSEASTMFIGTLKIYYTLNLFIE